MTLILENLNNQFSDLTIGSIFFSFCIVHIHSVLYSHVLNVFCSSKVSFHVVIVETSGFFSFGYRFFDTFLLSVINLRNFALIFLIN